MTPWRTCAGTGSTTARPPTVGGEKPHISLVANLDALRGIAGGTHETGNGDIIDIASRASLEPYGVSYGNSDLSARTGITRIVLGPDSEVLDVGRKARVWTTAQRRAIGARDRHCQGPGCRAQPQHCDIHHEDHWANGGVTSVKKGKLFCRPCHTIEHHRERLQRRIRERTEG
jgi:hypothetical protein